MELQIEPRPGAVRVIVQGPEDSEEVRRILTLLQSCGDRLWVLDDQRRTVAVAPESILWAETVDDRVFVYTAGAVYQAACSLTALELRWESVAVPVRQIHRAEPERGAKPAQPPRRAH